MRLLFSYGYCQNDYLLIFISEDDGEEEEAYSRVSYFSTEHIFFLPSAFVIMFPLPHIPLLFFLSLGYSLSFFVSINAILLKPVNVERCGRCHHHCSRSIQME